MSFKDVKELRTQGKLNEALKLALVELAIDSENIWNKRALAWVYYDFLKINSEYSKLNDFNRYWDNLMGIDLSEDNNQILHESVALQLGKVIFSVFRESELPTNVLDELFEKAKLLSIERPSKANSFLIKAFLKGSKTWPNIYSVLNYFGFEGFSDEDYLSEEYNGRAISSTVEKFYNTYSKYLLDQSKDRFTTQSIIQFLITEFIPKLDLMISAHPEYQFLPYFKAKLMLAAGQREGVLEAFLPFAKRKRNEFWVWEVMAEVFDEQSDERFACLCKALSLNSPEAYIVGLRSDFAKLLITRDKFSEAKYEIERIVSTRQANGWKISSEIQSILTMPWYSSTISSETNVNLYSEHLQTAEEILFRDVKIETIVVEFVNHDKQVLNFVINENKHGFFSYRGFLKKPTIGQLYDVRFAGASKDGFYKLLSIEESKQETSHAIKNFEGKLKLNLEGKFGFVDDIFVDPNLITKMSLENDQLIKGKAILSFNKKKNQWGWKILTLTANGI